MTWSLVAEYGLVYPADPRERPDAPLNFPSYAEKSEDGSCVIVDELSTGKNVPIRSECRTLRIDRDGSILYDSRANGIDDGDGRLIDEGCLALLRRTQWELLVVSSEGQVAERLPLWPFSKRWPRFVTWTGNRTFLCVFLDRARLLDIVEFDRQGRLLWCLRAGSASIGVPTSAQLLPNDHLLVTDEFRHVALELDRDSRVVWQYGHPEQPSDRLDALSSPRSAHQVANGRRLIADTRNHRVLAVEPDGRVEPLRVDEGSLSSPTSVRGLATGHCLVADAGNRRVVEFDATGQSVWQYGQGPATRRLLSFPRSVEPDHDGFLVADTANNRIVRVGPAGVSPLVPEVRLFWPRCARRTAAGALLIADGRNSRIVKVAADGLVRELFGPAQEDGPGFHDPHDVLELPNGRLLVVDPSPGHVVEIDWRGRVHWSTAESGMALSDPHSAQWLPDGTILICDSGNHRLVWVDRQGAIVREVSVLKSGSSRYRLSRPRHAEVAPTGALVVTDTGNNRVLGVGPDGEVDWELSEVPTSPTNTLDQPRWACLAPDGTLLVSDHYHHRVVRFRRE